MAKKVELIKNNLDQHTCESWYEGDWVFFHCQECAFQRKLNWKTGELVLLKAGDVNALHSGQHIPVQTRPQELLLN